MDKHVKTIYALLIVGFLSISIQLWFQNKALNDLNTKMESDNELNLGNQDEIFTNKRRLKDIKDTNKLSRRLIENEQTGGALTNLPYSKVANNPFISNEDREVFKQSKEDMDSDDVSRNRRKPKFRIVHENNERKSYPIKHVENNPFDRKKRKQKYNSDSESKSKNISKRSLK